MLLPISVSAMENMLILKNHRCSGKKCSEIFFYDIKVLIMLYKKLWSEMMLSSYLMNPTNEGVPQQYCENHDTSKLQVSYE